MKKAAMRCSACLLLILLACDTKAPEIQQFFWQINLVCRADSQSVHESLSVFFQVNDEDGIEDIERITVYSDANMLYWEIPFSQLEAREINKILWYGTNDLTMPDLKDFPPGEYYARISDFSGKYDDKRFFLNAAKSDRRGWKPPELIVQDGIITLRGDYRGAQLWFYSPEDDLVQALEFQSNRIEYDRIDKDGNAAYVKLYTYVNQLGCGVIRGDYPIH
ncbi:MAG: hypothetical protein JW874_01210 [Spirochaetales bacterium]|nr:hypothetical protein [Spirochaetales bacterium]